MYWLVVICRYPLPLLFCLVWLCPASGQQRAHHEPNAASSTAGTEPNASVERGQMIAEIDRQLSSQWDKNGIEPAAVATDEEFMRRACLDFAGVIPRVSELREFLADQNPDKRFDLLQQLSKGSRSATHLATVWRNRILPAGAEESHPNESIGLQKWLRARYARNLRYDALVAGLLLATGAEELGPALYYQANDLQPEKLAASVSELFLGMKLQCAQCHDHPYAEFSQRDFWGLAAFFAQVQSPETRGMQMSFRLVDTDRGDVRLPDTEEIVLPKYLLVDQQVDDSFSSRRENLVLWLTSRDNRYFARAGVNWAWAHFFGRGLVESLEQVSADDSVNAQLLDEVADYFVQTGFDLRELMLTIASTRAYQLSSWQNVPQGCEPSLFACMLPRPLSPEQLYDSYALLSPRPLRSTSMGARSNAIDAGVGDDPVRARFVRRMREPPGDPTEYRAGTLQALMLMNGVTTADVTSADRSHLLGALGAPFMSDDQRIESLFLAALSRHPTENEKQLAIDSLAAVEKAEDRDSVISDLLWAMLNSTEFAFNR